jgi:hypothetical protein
MTGSDCRCPGCGTCDAASEAGRLRKSLRESQQRYAELSRMNENYIKHLHAAERERDELKARLAHAEADAEQAIHNEAFTERQRIFLYIRARLARSTMDDRVSMRERGVMIDLANAIDRGEHE